MSGAKAKKAVDSVTKTIERTFSDALRGYHSIKENEDGKNVMRNHFNTFFLFANTLALLANGACLLTAYLREFPISPDQAIVLYPNIMNVWAAIPAVLLIVYYISMASDMMMSVYIYSGGFANPIDKLMFTRYSNMTSFRFFLFQLCIMGGGLFLWFEFDPWYYFGMITGALGFLLTITDGVALLYFVKLFWSFFKDAKYREEVKSDFESYKDDISAFNFREWACWQLPLSMMKAYLVMQVFTSLFASSTFNSQPLGDMSQADLYVTLMTVIVGFGTLVFDVWVKQSGIYVLALAFYFMSLAVFQSSQLGGLAVIKLWGTSTGISVVFFFCSIIMVFVSYVRYINLSHMKGDSKGAVNPNVAEKGLTNLLCGFDDAFVRDRVNNSKKH